MGGDAGGGKARDAASLMLEERISHLEYMKSFQDEMVKIIRIYTSNENFTSERCLQETVNFIAKKFRLGAVSVFLVDDLSRELVLYVCSSKEPLDPIVKSFRISHGRGLTGQCARSGETLMSNDVSKDGRFFEGPFRGTRSQMVVPVKIKHRIAGVLDLQDTEKGRFKPEFARLMEDITLNIGFVLETKQLYNDLRLHNEQLENRMGEKVEELKKSEERYRAIVENAADLIFTTDAEGHFTWANQAACTQLGYAIDNIRGINISRILKKGHRHKLYAILHDILEDHPVKPVQMEIVTRSGEERTVDFSCVAIRENGRVAGMEGILRDITDRVVVEKLKKNYVKSLEEAVIERTAEIKETQRASILAIATLAESIDEDTGGHLERIRHYCKILAQDLRANSRYADQITEEYIELVFDLSPLHDLGKVAIRDYILQKPDKLTCEEYETMKEHATVGARALRMAGEMIHRESIFTIGEMIAHYHHEKWDGTGYPAVDVNGEHRPLQGEEIPLCARIVALADVYDALTSKRPYKMPFPHDKARELILQEKGRHFDPETADSFLRCEKDFIDIRRRFPETKVTLESPFDLSAGEHK